MAAMRVVSLEEATGLVPVPPTPVISSEWPADIQHLSPSSMKKFMECPDKWRKHYLLREREITQGYWLFQGSTNHRSIDWALKEKMTTGKLPEVKQILERFDHEWTMELSDRGGVEALEWRDSTPGEAKDQTAGLVKAYVPIAQMLDPIALEQKWEIEVPHVPVPLMGYIDIELEDRLIDRKDVARRERKPKPDWVMQGGIYTAVKQKPIDFHVSTKTKMPMVYTPGVDPELAMPAWSTQRMHLYVQRVARAISTMYTQYGPHEVWPGATLHPFACDYCGLRANCAWWAE
jgi:hypothetical protein